MAALWFIVRDDQEHGPLDGQQLKAHATAGQLHPHDLIRRADWPAPRAARVVKTLFQAAPAPLPPGGAGGVRNGLARLRAVGGPLAGGGTAADPRARPAVRGVARGRRGRFVRPFVVLAEAAVLAVLWILAGVLAQMLGRGVAHPYRRTFIALGVSLVPLAVGLALVLLAGALFPEVTLAGGYLAAISAAFFFIGLQAAGDVPWGRLAYAFPILLGLTGAGGSLLSARLFLAYSGFSG
jgi:hypothetical protein